MAEDSKSGTQHPLLALRTEWRAFERPPLHEGAPDYSQAQRAAWTEGLGDFGRRLDALDRSNWPVSQQVDWHLLRAELNGLPIRITDIAPGLVETEFSIVRFAGDTERASKVYDGYMPLTAADIAETIRWAVMLPAHVNIDEIVVKPLAQASATQVARGAGL